MNLCLCVYPCVLVCVGPKNCVFLQSMSRSSKTANLLVEIFVSGSCTKLIKDIVTIQELAIVIFLTRFSQTYIF